MPLEAMRKTGSMVHGGRHGGALQLKSAAKDEACRAVQKGLLEATLDTDLADLATRLEQRRPSPRPPLAAAAGC